MSAGQDQGPAVVRRRQHVEAVRRDAQRAVEQIAAAGTGPGRLTAEAISWALGERDRAPFSGAPGGASPAEIEAEIAACRGYLRSAPWSEETDQAVRSASRVLKVLEWLTGADDRPPACCPGTEPGDLVGGRGLIVRPGLEIRRMIAAAGGKLAAGEGSHGLGGDWHLGVIATLTWVEGDRAVPPMAHGGTVACMHPDSAGRPGPREIWRERTAAEQHIAPLGYKHGDIAFHYADAVAFTLRWLYGETITPPVTGGG